MNPYRLKNIKLNVYYQPTKGGNTISENRGKIYTTKNHGLSSFFRHVEKYPDKNRKFCVYASVNSHVFKNCIKYKMDGVPFKIKGGYHKIIEIETEAKDWIIEEI